jgi:hypothetical protein
MFVKGRGCGEVEFTPQCHFYAAGETRDLDPEILFENDRGHVCHFTIKSEPKLAEATGVWSSEDPSKGWMLGQIESSNRVARTETAAHGARAPNDRAF